MGTGLIFKRGKAGARWRHGSWRGTFRGTLYGNLLSLQDLLYFNRAQQTLGNQFISSDMGRAQKRSGLTAIHLHQRSVSAPLAGVAPTAQAAVSYTHLTL